MPKKRDYEVGYKKPPTHTQFQPGESGNPGGRKKGSRSFRERLRDELAEVVSAVENGKNVRVSKLDLIFKGAVNAGARGNVQAIKQIFALMEAHGLTKEEAFVLDTSDEVLVGIIDRCMLMLDKRGKSHLYEEIPPSYYKTKRIERERKETKG